MGLVSRSYTYSAGAIIVASQHNDNENTLYNLVNGSLSTANLVSNAGIVDTQLASITTAGKVNVSALTVSSQAQGDILYASGASTFARLGAGTSGQILKTNGAAANPAWATYSDLFLTPKEYTDVADTSTNDNTTTSASYQDTDLSITFTVGKQGLVIANFSGMFDPVSSGNAFVALLVDGVVKMEVGGIEGSGNSKMPASLGWSGVLSAASHTIKVQVKSDGSGTSGILGSACTSRLNVSHPS